MNYSEKNKSIKRCYNIVTEYGGIEEFLKRIEESINDTYPKEQCYKDILENADFNIATIIEFIKYVMQSGNKEDIDLIISNVNAIDPDLLSYIIEELAKDDKLKQLLISEIRKGLIAKQDTLNKNVFYKFLKTLENGNEIIEENLKDFIYGSYDFRLINKILEEMKISDEKILEIKTNILNNAKGENIIYFIKWFKEKGALNDTDIELEEFVKALHSDIEDKTTLKMLEIIYKELMEKQKLKVEDIELCGRGASNGNYKIGQFILKLGGTRQTERIPYHKRILQPIIRQDISTFNENNLYIEIQNEVNSKWYENMQEEQIQEELYQIYKEMRKDGVIWTDIKKENVGRLIKPNRTNYYTETLEGDIKKPETLEITQKELEVSDDSVGIFGRKNEECLKPGELVILDTDFLFKEEDIDIEEEMQERRPAKYIIYEKRYRYELEQEKEER